MESYKIMRIKHSKLITILIYVSFICYLLAQSQSLNNWSYTLHEMLHVPLFITTYALPVLSIFWIYYAIKSRHNKRIDVGMRLRAYTKNGLIIISLAYMILFFSYHHNTIQASGVYTVEDKIDDGKSYWIVLFDKKIKCTRNEYNLINENEQYLISYTWYERSSEKGKLEHIEIAD